MLIHDLNLTTDRPTFVTHLECSLTGERYEADRLHGLSAAGKPLLVRYDLDGVRATLTKEALAARPMDLWRWRELLPVRQTSNIVSLGENATPLIPLPRTAKRLGRAQLLAKDEGRLPTASFKARGLVMAVSMAKELGVTQVAMPTNGNAGAALLSYGGSAASVAALITDPAELATRSSNGTLNGNLLTVTSTLRGNGSVEQAWTALIATHGNLLAATKSENTTAQSRSDQAVAAREAVSGVDLDMEAADLLRLQQAYSGCAKILQIAKETIDSILNII